jgi:hypothetical protein
MKNLPKMKFKSIRKTRKRTEVSSMRTGFRVSLKKMSTFGVHRLDWLVVSKRFPWNAKYETVKMSTFSLHRLGWLMVRT